MLLQGRLSLTIQLKVDASAAIMLPVLLPPLHFLGFPGGSAGKESACNAGDSSLIPGTEKFPREGTGYSLQCSWASLVAQIVKNPPAMQETWVQSLGWEDPLEKGMATHSSILADDSMDRGAWPQAMGSQRELLTRRSY